MRETKLVVATKQLIVARLQDHMADISQELDCHSIRYTGTEELSAKTLEFFIGPSSHFFFDALQLDLSFLKEEVEKWSDLLSYQAAMKTVRALKVVNDSAERGIALATAFNSTLTKQEEQKQYLFQIVESHRQRFPNPKKSTLLPMLSVASQLVTEN